MKSMIPVLLVVAYPAIALAQSPTYDIHGFPLSLHQAQVTGLAEVGEQVAVPSEGPGGLPASPTQLLLLTPRAGAPTDVVSNPSRKDVETAGVVLARAARH